MPRNMEKSMDNFHDALAEVIREVVEFEPGMLVTLLKTKVTRNFRHASALISVLPTEKEEIALTALTAQRHEIKQGLAERLRMPHIPSIYWTFDETEAEAAKIDNTINELKARGEL
jgi:ribosome-binding factor A